MKTSYLDFFFKWPAVTTALILKNKSDCMLYKVQEKISLQLTTCDDDNLL